MANSVYWKNCIREIRQAVYGRDNRKPIADAIEGLEANPSDLELLDELAAKLQTAVGTIRITPMETWYTYDYRDIELRSTELVNDKTAEAISDQLSVELDGEQSFDAFDISWDDADFTWDLPTRDPDIADYKLVDEIEGDTVSQISGEDSSYLWIVPNPATQTYVHYGEDYLLTIARINGR